MTILIHFDTPRVTVTVGRVTCRITTALLQPHE
jgi:hypothetical protein